MDAILLDIPDIKGQSTIKGFEDKIEVLSMSHGVAMQVTASPSATERTSGRPNHQDLTVSKYVDLSTCPLIAACNAGTNLKERTLRELTPEAWDMMISTNLDGAFYCTKAVLPQMFDRKDGVIVNVVSVAGKRANPLGGAASVVQHRPTRMLIKR